MYSFHIGSCGEKWLPLYLNQKLSLSICLGFPLCQFSFASLVHWLKGFPTCSSSLWYYSLSFFKCSIHLHISKIYNINFISVPFVYFEVFWQESLTILLTITSKEKTGGCLVAMIWDGCIFLAGLSFISQSAPTSLSPWI